MGPAGHTGFYRPHGRLALKHINTYVTAFSAMGSHLSVRTRDRKRRPSWRASSCAYLLRSSGYPCAKRARRYSPTPIPGKRRGWVPGSLAQQLPGLFMAIDGEGRVVVWNEQCEQLTGWTVAEVRSRTPDASSQTPSPAPQPNRHRVGGAQQAALLS